jgi:MoxR-like ATPase
LNISNPLNKECMMAATGEGVEKLEDMIVRAAETTAQHIAAAKASIGAVIFGQDRVVEEALTTVLAGGHAMLVGVPGLAKTKLVDAMGTVLGLDARRIQFTPDLMPSDILGSEVLEEGTGGKRNFRFIPGPIFGQLLMADEINRASPRTQSALLQAMQEQHVTVAGQRHDVPKPFHVLATQNPIEQEGTYPLPEAQLDRFLMQIDVDYPDRDAERRIVFETTGVEEAKAKPAMTADELMAAQRLVRRLPVGESVINAILTLVRSARPGPEAGELGKLIAWGPSPRASQSLMLLTRARALLDGRLAPSIDDVLALAEPVFKHRMALTFSARADGETLAGVIGKLKARIG